MYTAFTESHWRKQDSTTKPFPMIGNTFEPWLVIRIFALRRHVLNSLLDHIPFVSRLIWEMDRNGLIRWHSVLDTFHVYCLCSAFWRFLIVGRTDETLLINLPWFVICSIMLHIHCFNFEYLPVGLYPYVIYLALRCPDLLSDHAT